MCRQLVDANDGFVRPLRATHPALIEPCPDRDPPLAQSGGETSVTQLDAEIMSESAATSVGRVTRPFR